LIEWRSPDRVEESIVVFKHNIVNLYFCILVQIRALCVHSSYYDKVYKVP